MPIERSNVDFPLWRKKVDQSLFEHKATPIPLWAWQMWGLEKFERCRSVKENRSKVTIFFERKKFEGWITVTKGGLRRLIFDADLAHRLKHTFLMSYMRSLEGSLSEEKPSEIEKRISFWEFVDIEYNREETSFLFVAHYKQEPSFPHLFSKLIDSPRLKKVAGSIRGDNKPGIEKQNWMSRDEFPSEITAKNVIYQLLDSKKQLMYIGETIDLVRRFHQGHHSIEDWDFFRYSLLPDELEPYRVTLERMLIRDFASLLPNNGGVKMKDISGYRLANDKIDKK